MSRVTELRTNLLHAINPPTPLNKGEFAHYERDLDFLIAVAKEEGADEESRKWVGALNRAVKEGTLGKLVSNVLDGEPVPTKHEGWAVVSVSRGYMGKAHEDYADAIAEALYLTKAETPPYYVTRVYWED